MVAAAGPRARVSESGIKLTARTLGGMSVAVPAVPMCCSSWTRAARWRRTAASKRRKAQALGLLDFDATSDATEVSADVFRGEGADLVLPFRRATLRASNRS